MTLGAADAAAEAYRRRRMLELLLEAPQCMAPVPLLKRALAEIGLAVSTDRLRTDLAWLAEQGLVTMRHEPEWIATLTVRGGDVATGVAESPGVSPRSPQD